MNKNAVYLAVFGVLCVLAGVVAGAVVTKKTGFPCIGPDRPDFARKAERFMWQGPKGLGQKGPREMLRREPGRNKDFLLSMLVERLDLNPEQQVKVGAILEKTRQNIEEVGEKIRSSITDIKKESDEQIMTILTPDQQEVFKGLLEKLKEQPRPFKAEGDFGPMPGRVPGMNDDRPPQR